MALLVGTQAVAGLVENRVFSTVLTAAVSLGILLGATLLTPSSPRRRGLSWAWFGPAVALLAFYSYDRFYGGYFSSGGWDVDVLFIVVMAAVFAGGWLTLRGRSGLTFISIVASPVAACVVYFLVMRVILWPIYDNYESRQYDCYRGGETYDWDGCKVWGMSEWDFHRFYGAIQASLTMVLLVIGVVAAAWVAVALVPAEWRRSQRREALRAERAAFQAQYAAAGLVPGQGVVQPDGTVAAVLSEGAVAGPQPGVVYVPVQVGAAPGVAPGVAPGAVPSAPGTRATNGFAVASLVLGVIGGSVLAIVFGHVARHQNRRTGQGGSGMALAGLILGYVWLVATLVWVVVVIVLAVNSEPTYYPDYYYY